MITVDVNKGILTFDRFFINKKQEKISRDQLPKFHPENTRNYLRASGVNPEEWLRSSIPKIVMNHQDHRTIEKL